MLVLIVASMILGACGGSGAGSTWFNLPSVPVQVQADGSARVFGFNVGAILTADQIGQLQASNIQQLNVRIGHNGVHFYANGEDLPYIAWDDASFATVQEILPKLSGPLNINGDQIGSLLPWARRIGLGAAVNLPVGSGQSALDIPRWSGETSFTPETPSEVTIGPLDIAGVAINPSDGSISLDGMPISQLGEAFGVALDVAVPANLLEIFAAIDAETVTVTTNPNGIDLTLNGDPLPSLAYDSASLGRTLALIDPLVTDAALAAQLNDLVPQLPGAQLNVLASLTGEPAGQTALSNVKLTLDEQGTLGAYGFPIVNLVPPATVQQLQAANLQQIDAKIEGGDTLMLAANGKTIPSIAWNNDTLPVLSQLVGGFTGLQPTFLSTLINVLKDTGVNASINLPLADGTEAIAIGDPFADGIQAPDMGDFAPPVLHLNVAYDVANNLQSIGPITAQELQDQMGVALPGLPANLVAALNQVGANDLQAVNSPGQFDLMINSASAVALKYDVDSLVEVLDLVSPFLAGTIMEDPAISGLIQQEILPLVPGSDLNVNVLLNQ